MRKKDILSNLQAIPSEMGIIFLKKEEDFLYVRRTKNIRKSITNFFTSRNQDDVLFQLISQTTDLDWNTETNQLQILATEKEMLKKSEPQFNDKLNFWRNYFYLTIDFYNVPYFSTAEDTQKKKFYIGPFRSNFFIIDVIGCFAELLKAPACEGEDFPCERLKKQQCLGYCVEETKKIQNLIRKYYLHPNWEFLKRKKQDQENLLRGLQFTQAELLKKQINLIESYYKHLQFLLSIKTIKWEDNIAGIHYRIEDGILAKAGDFEFPIIIPEYRENEILAVNKEHLDEMLWCYEFLSQHATEKLDKQKQKSIEELIKSGYLES